MAGNGPMLSALNALCRSETTSLMIKDKMLSRGHSPQRDAGRSQGNRTPMTMLGVSAPEAGT